MKDGRNKKIIFKSKWRNYCWQNLQSTVVLWYHGKILDDLNFWSVCMSVCREWKILQKLLLQGGNPSRSWHSNIIHCHSVSGNIWPNNRLAPPSLVGLTPPSGKSWIRHCPVYLHLSWLYYCTGVYRCVISRWPRVVCLHTRVPTERLQYSAHDARGQEIKRCFLSDRKWCWKVISRSISCWRSTFSFKESDRSVYKMRLVEFKVERALRWEQK